MELWDLYDRQRQPLGRTHVRGEKLSEGEFHIVVNILSVNEDGKIFITKRHPDKPHGDKWEITGGSALAGETSQEAALRELREETGLETDGLLYYGTIIRQPSGCIHDFYLNRGDFSEQDIFLQENETVDLKLVSADELYQMAKSGEFLDFLYNRIKGVFSDIFGEKL